MFLVIREWFIDLWHAGYNVCYWALNNVALFRNNGNLAWYKPQSRNNSVAPNNGARCLDESKNRLSVCSIVGRPLTLAGVLNFHRPLIPCNYYIYMSSRRILVVTCKNKFTTFPAKIVHVSHSCERKNFLRYKVSSYTIFPLK